MKFSEWIALSQNTYKSIRLVYVDDNGKEVKRIFATRNINSIDLSEVIDMIVTDVKPDENYNCMCDVYLTHMFSESIRDQIEKAYEEHSETASSLTEAAYPGTYVVPNYECMGYVLYIGDIDDELDGLYIGGFDTDYYELECNVRLFSYRFKSARSIKCE